MLFIVSGHLIDQNGITKTLYDYSTLNQFMLLSIGSANRIAVSVFLLIGTWFMVDAKFRASRLIDLYVQMFFLTSITSILVYLFGFDAPVKKIIFGFLPYTTRSLWFVSVYMVLLILSPFLHKIIELGRKPLSLIVAIVFTFLVLQCSIYPFSDSWLDGISFFIFIYLLMGYYKLYLINHIEWNRYVVLLGSFIFYMILILTQLAINENPLALFSGKCHQFLIDYKTLPNLIISFGVFYFFSRSDFGHKKFINILAKSSLTVYIVHQTPAFIPVLWNSLLYVPLWIHSNFVVIYVILSTIIVYLAISTVNPIWECVKSHIHCSRIYVVIENKIQSLYSF